MNKKIWNDIYLAQKELTDNLGYITNCDTHSITKALYFRFGHRYNKFDCNGRYESQCCITVWSPIKGIDEQYKVIFEEFRVEDGEKEYHFNTVDEMLEFVLDLDKKVRNIVNYNRK